MTERIYHADSACLEFDATVVSCTSADGRAVVVLDRTAFYPTSGGQPHDTGWLGEVPVLEVVELDGERIGHVAASPIAAGTPVHGRIDRARRVDHMQQHTGQHILSAAFDRLHGVRTVGFHLGALVSTIDLDRALGPAALAEAETEANRVVWEDRPLRIMTASSEEGADLHLRKEPTRTGPLRVIEVEGFDRSACGGTHVARTGEVGVIAIRAWEKFRGGLRVEFVCGGRALREFRVLRDAVAGSLRHLSVAPLDLPAAIEGAQAENKELRRAMRGLTERLAVHEASALVQRARPVGAARLVVEALEGWDQAGLKALASAGAAQPGVVAALLSAGPDPAVAAIACAPGTGIDASAVLKALVARFGGKGGGKPDLAQGGGMTGDRSAMRDLLEETIAASLRPAP